MKKKRLLAGLMAIVMMTGMISYIPAGASELSSSFEATRELQLKFNDNVTDTSVNAFPTTLNGTANYVEGVEGKALSLDGSSNYIDLGTSGKLQPSNLTVSFWVKAPAEMSGEHIIMWNKPSGAYDGNGWYLSALDNNTPLKLSVGNKSGEVQPLEAYVTGSRSQFFPVNEWVHIAVTFDSTAKAAKIYRNGAEQTVAYVNDNKQEIVSDDTNHKYLGFNSPIYNGGYAKLILDDYEIYSSVASEDDVRALYSRYVVEEDPINDTDIVNSDYSNLTISTQNVISNLEFPTAGAKGSKIEWESSNQSVISNTGVVSRPAAGQPDVEVTVKATVSSGAYSKIKTFVVTVSAYSNLTGMSEFELDQVEVTDAYYASAMNQDIAFLLKFDADRMLSGFRTTANLDTLGKQPYKGWESSLIGGHCMGHYLTACAQAYKTLSVNDQRREALYTQITYIVDELKKCQDETGTGFIFGAKINDPAASIEIQFDNVEQGKTNITSQAWVPWYTTHKIITALVDIYKLVGDEQALTVASGLGDWTYNRVSKWSDATRATVLGIEYGGMNDCLYELYKYTQKEEHAKAAHIFDEDVTIRNKNLFREVLAGNTNVLNGKHANATMPKFLGALNRYRVMHGKVFEGETVDASEYLEFAKAFWDMVIEKHVYITGGASVMEHFKADNALDASRTQCNCESCCAGVMLELSRELYKITGERKYADYYETTLRNAVMGSINTKDGTVIYFVPMATGYYKIFSNPDPANNMFLCCVGSGMEHYTKLGDSIYFYNDTSLVVNQYVASTVSWAEKNIKVVQSSDVTKSETAEFTISLLNGQSSQQMDLYLRIPDWIAGRAEIKVNGASYDAVVYNGYAAVKRTWKSGDKVTINLPMKVVAYGLPDNDTVFGFKYGPTVLAAKLGTEKMGETTWSGVDFFAPLYKVVGNEEARLEVSYGGVNKQVLGTETLLIQDEEVSMNEYIEYIDEYLVKDETADGLSFRLQGTDAEETFDGGLEFVPFNTLNDQRYGIYWYFQDQYEESTEEKILEEKREGRFSNSIVDSTQPGYGQYENDNIHQMQGGEESTASTIAGGGSTRQANAGGYFSYNMRINKDKTNYIICQFAKEDNGKTIKISIGDTVIAAVTLDYTGTLDFYTISYEIPNDVLLANAAVLEVDGEKCDVVRIKFESNDANASARLVGGLWTTVNYNNDASIKSLTADVGTVVEKENAFDIIVPKSTTRVGINVSIADASGLLYVDGILVNDAKKQRITLVGDTTSVALKVYAEDHETFKEYTVTVMYNQNLDAVEETIAKINAIGTVQYTQACKAKIDAARKAYDALTTSQQESVTNYSTLQTAENLYAQLKKTADDKAAAEAVIAKIKSIGTVTQNSKAKIEAAEKAYAALTADQKKLVTNYQTLKNARTAYNKLVSVPANGKICKVGSYQYKVTKSAKKNGTVELVKPNKKTLKKATVQNTVKINGYTFKVTSISKNAFKNNTKLSSVKIGTNVKTIGVGAFKGCKKLRNITINTTKLNKVGSKAFSGTHKNAVVKVPSKKLKSYQKLLKGKGLAKNSKIK